MTRAAPALGREDGPVTARPRRLSSYVSTTAVTASSIVANVVLSGILARAWPVADFLLFSSLRRYLATLHTVVTAEIRYGVVKYSFSEVEAERRRVLWNAVYVTAALFLLVAVGLQIGASWIYPFLGSPLVRGRWPILWISLWLLGQAWYHVGQAYLRSTAQIRAANALCFLAGTVVALGLAVMAAAMPQIGVPLFFGLTGLATVAVFAGFAFTQKSPADPAPDPGLSARMTAYAGSRFFDSLLRQLSYTLPVMLLSAMGLPILAGQIAVMVSLIRSFEGLFQPLIVLVFAESLGAGSEENAKRSLQATWDSVLALTLPVLVAAALASRLIVTLWLGSTYADLAPAFAMMCTTLLPTVAVVLIRGYLDSRSRFSPFVLLNAVSIAALACGAMAVHRQSGLTPLRMAALISLVNWLQLVVVYRMLVKAYGMSLFDGAVVRDAVAYARGRLGRAVS